MCRSEARRLFRRCSRGNVSGSPANGFVIPVHTAARVVGCPAGLFLEEADGPNDEGAAEDQPGSRPPPKGDQTSGVNLLQYNPALRTFNRGETTPQQNGTDLGFHVDKVLV